jgi:hypothetical protein
MAKAHFNFVPIQLQTRLPQAIFVSNWSISKKSSPLKLLGQMNRNLVGSIYGSIAIFNRGPSIDASYQVPVYLAKWFQRRRLKCEKLTDDRKPSEGKSSHCL